jgi:hypothetical protein
MRNRLILLFSVLVLALSSVYLMLSDYQIENVSVISKDGSHEGIQLPYITGGPDKAEYTFRFTMKKNFLSQDWIRIIPDDNLADIMISDIYFP